MSKREKLLLFALILLFLLNLTAIGKVLTTLSPWLLVAIFFLIFLLILQVKPVNFILIGLGVLVTTVWFLWLNEETIAKQMGNLAYFLILVGVFREIKGFGGNNA